MRQRLGGVSSPLSSSTFASIDNVSSRSLKEYTYIPIVFSM
jgi:hypothetical protein